MSLEAMVADLVAAADRWKRLNPQPEPARDEPRIEDRLIFVHVADPPPKV